MTKHLDNIENIKNHMMLSLSREFSKGTMNFGKIEERIQETKN